MTPPAEINQRVHRLICAALAALFLASFAPASTACDNDADCGPGGTCIKREKRARGVCYGRSAAENETPPASDATPPAANPGPAAVTGELRERATGWMGDPEAQIRDALPNAELGSVCIVTSDCPAGWECIFAGFEGRCVRP